MNCGNLGNAYGKIQDMRRMKYDVNAKIITQGNVSFNVIKSDFLFAQYFVVVTVWMKSSRQKSKHNEHSTIIAHCQVTKRLTNQFAKFESREM